MTLALFDFDGTITSKDSLLHFTRFAVGANKYRAGMVRLLPVLILHRLRVIPSQTTKNIFLSCFFKNSSVADFDNICTAYAGHTIKSIIYTAAIEKINWHKQQQHRVIVVSASPEAYLQKWCVAVNIECIGRKMQEKNGAITGRIKGANCNGSEKARRIKQYLNIDAYTEIYGYGNSRGDKQMLALCSKTFYKPFE